MKRGGETRKERFERLDLPALSPLPAERLQFLDTPVERRVSNDHHIAYEKAYYSVPHHLVSKIVTVRASSNIVEIRHDGQPVAIHPRSHSHNIYVTEDAHRPNNHQAYIELTYNDWKATLHPHVQAVADAELIKSGRHMRRERIMTSIRKLARTYSSNRLIKACERACLNQSPYIGHVRNLLSNNMEEQSPVASLSDRKPTQAKENIRGRTYFMRDLSHDGGGA